MMSDCLPVDVGFLYESRPIRADFWGEIHTIRAGNARKLSKSFKEYNVQFKKILALS